MKIIFLDIDGVLNSEQFYTDKTNKALLEEPFDRENALQLKKIADRTGAAIVLTSTWRRGWDPDPSLCTLEGRLLNELFASLDLRIFGKTDVLQRGRAEEIRSFLKSCPEKVTGYVIIDDNDFGWKKHHLSRHVVQTDFQNGGLKEEHAELAVQILNRRIFFGFL